MERRPPIWYRGLFCHLSPTPLAHRSKIGIQKDWAASKTQRFEDFGGLISKNPEIRQRIVSGRTLTPREDNDARQRIFNRA